MPRFTLLIACAGWLTGLALCGFTGRARGDGERPCEVTVILDATEVAQFDPVLIRVVVTNRTKQPLAMKDPLSSYAENVRFLAKPDAATQFREHRSVNFGAYGYGERVFAPIPAGGKWASYEMLVAKDTSLTATWGKLELIARVSVAAHKDAGSPFDSDTFSVKVTKRDAKELDRIRPSQSTIGVLMVLGGHLAEEDHETMSKFLDGVSVGNLKKHGTASLLLSRCRVAKTADQRLKAGEAWDKFEKALDPVSLEYYRLMLAEIYVERNEIKSARALLKLVPHRCFESEVVQEAIKEKLR